jgi:hypothetical protein
VKKCLKDGGDGIVLALAARFSNKAADDQLKDSTGSDVHQGNRIQCLQDSKIGGDQHPSHPKMEGEINDICQSIEQK